MCADTQLSAGPLTRACAHRYMQGDGPLLDCLDQVPKT